MTALTRSRREEWRGKIPLVFAAFVGMSLLSLMPASLSMFLQPISQQFGWSRALTSAGYTSSTVVLFILSPVFGALIDRYGYRRVALPGIVVSTITMSAFAFTRGSPTQWIALWLLYALTSIAIKATVWTAAVTRNFQRGGKGLALGFALSGNAAASAIVPPLANWLIATYGWRLAFPILAFGWGIVTLVVCWFFLREPEAIASKTHSIDRPADNVAQVGGLTLAEAWRSSSLWRLALSSFLIMIVTNGLIVHQIAILGEAGVSRTDAAWLASMAAVFAVIGKLLTGTLLDRFRPNWTGGISLAFTALAFALLIKGIRSPVIIIVAMIVNGYSLGAKMQITAFLTSRYGGARSFGKIYGFMNSVLAIGAGIGPVLAGFIFDKAGNYTIFLITGAVASIVSGLLVLSMPAYPITTPSEDAPT